MQTTVPHGKLSIGKSNVRTASYDAESVIGLRASIVEHGLLQPLIVTPKGKSKTEFAVIAGGRRLTAIQSAVADGLLPEDYAVPCSVSYEAAPQLTEISIAENLLRRDLHPHEYYTAFSRLETELTKAGTAPDDVAPAIAKHFGQPLKTVKQCLRLGNLHPKLFAMYAAGDMRDDMAKAFAATADIELQWSTYQALTKANRGYIGVQEIRKALGSLDYVNKQRLEFVGRDAYIAAGGKLTEDLFSTEVYIDNGDLLATLFNGKTDCARIAAIAALPDNVTVIDAVDYEVMRYFRCEQRVLTEAEAAELDSLSHALESIDLDDEDSLDDETKAKLERYTELDEREIEPPTDRPLFATIEVDSYGDVNTDFFAPRDDAKISKLLSSTSALAPAKPDDGLGADARSIMAEHRRSVVAAELYDQATAGRVDSKTTLAADLLTFWMLRAALTYESRATSTSLTITRHRPLSKWDDHAESNPGALSLINAAKSIMTESFITEGDNVKALALFRAADIETKNRCIGWLAAIHLTPSGPLFDDIAEQLEITPELTRKWWKPDAGWFGLTKKSVRIAQIAEVENDVAVNMANVKADTVSERAVNLMASYPSWVPQWLRFAHWNKEPTNETTA